MALLDCPDCNQKVSDNAASCPGCGNVLRAYNDLNFPSYHLAAVALVIATLTPALTSSAPWWLRIIMSAGLALFIVITTWIVPGITEHLGLRKLQRQGMKKSAKNAKTKGRHD
jgi:hypothetical protein